MTVKITGNEMVFKLEADGNNYVIADNKFIVKGRELRLIESYSCEDNTSSKEKLLKIKTVDFGGSKRRTVRIFTKKSFRKSDLANGPWWIIGRHVGGKTTTKSDSKLIFREPEITGDDVRINTTKAVNFTIKGFGLRGVTKFVATTSGSIDDNVTISIQSVVSDLQVNAAVEGPQATGGPWKIRALNSEDNELSTSENSHISL